MRGVEALDGAAADVEALDLSRNRLTELPAQVLALTGLRLLNLRCNQLTDIPPDFSSRLSLVCNLDLGDNDLAPESAERLRGMGSLQTLCLDGNGMSQVALADLPLLQVLDLRKNRLSHFPALTEVPGLTDLSLRSNLLHRLPRHLDQLASLVRLDLADNALTCSAEDSIGTLTALREIDLSYNKLSQSPLFDSCTALESLRVSNNVLKCFPESLGSKFEALRVLDVSHNAIRVIPLVVVDLMCVALEELVVAQNLIEHIPPLPIAKDGFCLRRFDFKGNKVTFEDVRELIELEFAGRIHLAHFYETVPQLLLGGVYLGSGEAARNVNVLVKLGITHILNAATMRHRQGSEPFQYLTLELEDTPGQEVLHLLEQAHKFIEAAVQQGGGVLIHCQAGVSRSVTIAASYLMRQQKMTAEEALEYVRSKRPAAKPISYFVEQLKLYEATLR